jgi:hypothetical protein
MKNTVIILSLLALIIGSCSGQTPKEQPSESEVIRSDIRPNEELVLDNVYTDTFEFVDFTDGEYRDLIYLKKDGREIVLYDDTSPDEEIRALNKGDKVSIRWRLERFYHEGGGEFYIGEFAEKITKIERLISPDCEVPNRKVLLKSMHQKKDFSLILAFCDNTYNNGYVLYTGQTERIPIQLDHEEIVEDRSEEGRPNVRNLFYNEIYRGEINGSYVLTLQGARFYGASYIRKKDGKTIELEVTDDLFE